MCLRNKVLKTLGYVRNFTYLGAANITSKQKSDMAKVAIKNVNINSFGGIYHILDVFSKLGFEKLTESVLGKRGSSGKAFCYGSVFWLLLLSGKNKLKALYLFTHRCCSHFTYLEAWFSVSNCKHYKMCLF